MPGCLDGAMPMLSHAFEMESKFRATQMNTKLNLLF
jgi:hypothetical protein